MFGKHVATFRQRVNDFWAWFPTVADNYFQTIEAGNCADLQHEMGDRVARIWEEFDWVFGPGPFQRGGHSFTVSGGGIAHRQFLAQYWADAAPELEGWTFYGSRQPADLSDEPCLHIDDVPFNVCELHLSPDLDEARKLVHVEVWHPMFHQVSEEQRDFALFLMLDQVLGEFGTDQWLGAIDVVGCRADESIPATRFRDYLHDLEVERGWRKLPPTESYSAYQLPSPDDRFPRSDTVVGTTSNMQLIQEFLKAEGPLEEDPLLGSGAEFAYVAFPSAVLPRGDEANFRGEIQDTLTEHLGSAGHVLGGAIGTQQTYIDLLLTDGKTSLAQVRRAIHGCELPSPKLHYFAKGRKAVKL